jgi:hypothetical protein
MIKFVVKPKAGFNEQGLTAHDFFDELPFAGGMQSVGEITNFCLL